MADIYVNLHFYEHDQGNETYAEICPNHYVSLRVLFFGYFRLLLESLGTIIIFCLKIGKIMDELCRDDSFNVILYMTKKAYTINILTIIPKVDTI